MAPHSSTFAWKVPWTEKSGGLQSMGSLESDTTEWFHFHFSLLCIGEGNVNPLQCSCLENPRDGGAWWATVYGVAQSQTRLKRFSSSSSSSSTFFPDKAMAPHSSTLAWKIPWTEEPGGLQSMGSLESDTTERLHFDFSLSCIGEGNGNPLQCSCLENPRDGKPGGLPSMGSHRVGHDWINLAATAAYLLYVIDKLPWSLLRISKIK